MSYFTNFSKVVSSQRFTTPHNLLLKSCNLPKLLVESIDPSINHLHTAKALVQTISILKNFQQSADNQYKAEIQSELQYLQKCRQQYQISIKKYIESNGNLTAEGIANVYSVASELGLNSGWLQQYLHEQIPNKVQYMSRSNLQDLVQALNKNHSNSPHIELVKSNLSKKQTSEPDYVRRIGNQVNVFEYCQGSQSSNLLIKSIESKTPYPAYVGRKWIDLIWNRVSTYFSESPKYYLHQN